MAAQAIRSGSIDIAMVIGAEVNSRVVDWSDRSTCILFGDGSVQLMNPATIDPGTTGNYGLYWQPEQP